MGRRVRFTALIGQEVGVARFDLTDFEWSVIEPLLPTKVWGVKRVDDRRVLNGIFWRLRKGAPSEWSYMVGKCSSTEPSSSCQ